MVAFASWHIISASSVSLKNQGINILINIFFNPVVNAARGIAYQVDAVLSGFSMNFYSAVRPQIVKNYASGNIDGMYSLVFNSAKMAFFLIMVLAIPFLLEVDYILGLWLTEVPEYTSLFIRLIIIIMLIDVFNNPLFGIVQAVGKVKIYQLTICSMEILILPVSFIFLYFGFPPETPLYVCIAFSIIFYFPRLIVVNKLTGISIRIFFKKVILICFSVFVVSFLPTYFIWKIIHPSFYRLAVIIICDVFFTAIAIYIIGLTKMEKQHLILILKNKINGIKFFEHPNN
jgi:O-antigen/teichoic acid export membrane protein